MKQILKPSWWVGMIVSTLLTMFFIYLIKQVTNKFEVPFVSDVVASV